MASEQEEDDTRAVPFSDWSIFISVRMRQIITTLNFRRYFVFKAKMDITGEHNYFRSDNLPLEKNKYQCQICAVVFKHYGSLYKHLKRAHKVRKIGANNIKCMEEQCNEGFNKLERLEAHLHRYHLKKIDKQKLFFESLDDFKTWKREMEKETGAEYVAYSPGSSLVQYFKCSRSGVYKEQLSQGRRRRRLKAQGSKKSGAYCISRMVVQINDSDGAISVNFCKTHYGHTMELAHLSLSRIKEDEIAASSVQEVSLSANSDPVRNSITDNEIEQIHLLTEKDIKDMAIERHKNDLLSVNLWIKELEACGHSPVILHKNEGEKKIGFDNDDFLLGLMTCSQGHMLKNFGNGGVICMDRTHGTNPYNLILITLMVVDDFHEGFPVAFLYTNKDDMKAITAFLSAIRSITGQIDAAVFMSDDADQYCNSWRSVMGGSFQKLLCSWHVDRSWRTNVDLIENKDKREDVYKLLKIIQCETRKNIFDDLYLSFLKELRLDSELENFYNYFETHYSDRTEMWAYCHRVECKVDTIMCVESLHRVIKHVDMGGVKIRRLDRSIDVLMKLVKEKIFERMIKLHEGKAIAEITDIESEHRKVLKFPEGVVKRIDSITWNFTSRQDCTSECVVEKVSPDLLAAHICNLKCISCDCCVHSYTCTCTDFLIKGSMCKHVHAVALNEKANTVMIPVEPGSPGFEENDETDILVEDVTENDDLEKEKERILSLLQSVTVKVENEENIKTLNSVKKYLKCAESLLNSDPGCLPKESRQCQVLQEHPKKKMKQQRKSTCHSRKKRKPDPATLVNQVEKDCYFEKQELMESLLEIDF